MCRSAVFDPSCLFRFNVMCAESRGFLFTKEGLPILLFIQSISASLAAPLAHGWSRCPGCRRRSAAQRCGHALFNSVRVVCFPQHDLRGRFTSAAISPSRREGLVSRCPNRVTKRACSTQRARQVLQFRWMRCSTELDVVVFSGPRVTERYLKCEPAQTWVVGGLWSTHNKFSSFSAICFFSVHTGGVYSPMRSLHRDLWTPG